MGSRPGTRQAGGGGTLADPGAPGVAVSLRLVFEPGPLNTGSPHLTANLSVAGEDPLPQLSPLWGFAPQVPVIPRDPQPSPRSALNGWSEQGAAQGPLSSVMVLHALCLSFPSVNSSAFVSPSLSLLPHPRLSARICTFAQGWGGRGSKRGFSVSLFPSWVCVHRSQLSLPPSFYLSLYLLSSGWSVSPSP